VRYRHELKYAIGNHDAHIISRRLSAVMRPDSHGGVYRVHNLYFDDMYGSAYHDKMRGCLRRSKWRVRYYNGDLGFIRLERKAREGQLTYKESAPLTPEQLCRLRRCDFGCITPPVSPLLASFLAARAVRRLRPAAEFSYVRQAYTYAPGDVRVTLDSGVGTGVPGLAPTGILELKYGSFLPRVISDILGGVGLRRTEMSKYCYVAGYERSMKPHAR
jgi:hypothetical protein